jgi:hypothetical protein
MGISIKHNINPQEQVFNGLRRTQEGMLYLTHINPNESGEIQFSTYVEEGKSDNVPKDGTDYVAERDEVFNCQNFVGDGSTATFTLNANMGTLGSRLYVVCNSVRKDSNLDYKVSGTTLTFNSPPLDGWAIMVAQLKKRYYNNDSDSFQQFVFDVNTTTTYLINSNGELVKRVNHTASQESTGDDFLSFESTTASVNSSTYQDGI